MVAVSRNHGLTWTIQMQTQPGTGLLVSAIEDPNNGSSGTRLGVGFETFPQVTVGPEGALIVEVFSPIRDDWHAIDTQEPRPGRWPKG